MIEQVQNKKYNIIYADPAWSYNDKMHAGERGADYKYKTMSIPEICNLPIRNIASDNSRLFLWVTMPFIFEAEKVMNAWGFDFKTCGFVWIKTNPKGDKAMKEVNKLFKDKFEENKLVSIEELLPLILKLCFMGNGSYSRSNAELCLVGTRGKMERKSASVRSVIFSPIREHSEKPPEARERIEQLYGDVPRVELFARGRASEGWDIWGNEAIDGITL